MERRPKNATTNHYDSRRVTRPGGSQRPSGTSKASGNQRPSGTPKASGNQRPSGNARPSGTPKASGNQRPSGNSRPSGNPKSSGTSRPSGNPKSSGTSRPSGNPKSGGTARASASAKSSANQRATAASLSAGTQSYETRAKARKRRRREEELRKKRRLIFGAAAVLVVLIALALFIIISSVTVPEPSQLKLESSAETQILTWKGKTKNISYQIFRKTGDGDFELVTTIPEGNEHSFVSSDLSSATLYEYKIVATKGTGEKMRESKGKTVRAYTLPQVIEGMTAMTLSKDSLTLSWPTAQPVTGYELKMDTSADLANAEVLEFTPQDVVTNESTGALSYTIPNLTEGTSYSFSIRSFCGEDIYSEWSEVVSATVTKAIDMTGIDINKPMVALTFDDGPDNGEVTYRILDALAAVGGHATFFQLGQLCENYPEVAKRITDSGSQIACHTYDHEHMGEAVTEEDITRANDAIETTSGVRPTAFRAPGGEPSELIRNTCISQGQAIYHWSVDTRDWASRDADSVVTEVQNNTSDGDIILMHNIYSSTADAVERIVPWLVEQGYQLVTVDQLIQAKTGQPPVPGTEYHTAVNTK